MRLLRYCVLGLGTLLANQAWADTVVQNVSFSASVVNGDAYINANGFNSALGTLTGVTVMVTGTYNPFIYSANTESLPSQANLNYSFFLEGSPDFSSKGTLETYGLTAQNAQGDMSAAAQNFSFSASVSGDLSDYIGRQATTIGWIDLVSRPAINGDWGGGAADDLSEYRGTFEVIYTYTVPEPASIALLATGGSLLAFFFRRRKRPSSYPLSLN